MTRLIRCITLALVSPILLHTMRPASRAAEPFESFRIMVFSKTTMYRHTSISNGIAAIHRMGAERGFGVEATEDSGVFAATNLTRFRAVVFLSTSGDILNEAQEEALKGFILGGGGLVGVHAAIPGPQATEEKWKWYEDAYCTAFTNHSAIVPAVIRVEQTNHPSTRMLPREWRRVDEWYNFSRSPRPGVSALLALDETTYTGGTMGADHPIAWHRAIGKGRLWFTALGHTEATFAEPLFLEHLLGGILWAAGRP